MTLTPLEEVLIAGFGATVTAVATALVTSRVKDRRLKTMVSIDQCLGFRNGCSVQTIARDLRHLCRQASVQGKLIRLLAEKAGISVKEQIELETENEDER